MKKLIFLVAFLVIAQVGFSQKIKSSKVPTAVKTAFIQKFSGLKVEKWEFEEGNYEAEFDSKEDFEMSAVFTADGKWIETEQEISKSALPAPVLAALGSKKVKEAAKIMRADGSVIYEAEVGKVDLLFDEMGKIVK